MRPAGRPLLPTTDATATDATALTATMRWHRHYPFSYDAIVREYLMDALAPVHMDHGYLVDRIIAELHKIVNEDPLMDKYLSLSLNNCKDRGRLAYVAYDVMQAERCPRPPVEIAVLMETCTSFMRGAEKELKRQPSYSPLCEYVRRLAGELFLPQWCVSAVEEACWHSLMGQDCVSTPEHYIGALLLEVGHLLETDMIGMAHMLTRDKVAAAAGCGGQRLCRLRARLSLAEKMAVASKLLKFAALRHLSLPHLGCVLAHYQAGELTKQREKSDFPGPPDPPDATARAGPAGPDPPPPPREVAAAGEEEEEEKEEEAEGEGEGGEEEEEAAARAEAAEAAEAEERRKRRKKRQKRKKRKKPI